MRVRESGEAEDSGGIVEAMSVVPEGVSEEVGLDIAFEARMARGVRFAVEIDVEGFMQGKCTGTCFVRAIKALTAGHGNALDGTRVNVISRAPAQPWRLSTPVEHPGSDDLPM